MNLDQMLHDLREHYLFLRRIEQELKLDEDVLVHLHETQESTISLQDAVADLRDDILGASAKAHRKALRPLLANSRFFRLTRKG